MTPTALRACAVLLLALPPAAAQRWELKYFYDKNDSSLALTDLQFPSARRGVALGVVVEQQRRKPVVLLTANGGDAWELLPLKDLGVSLFFLHEQAGWMVTQNGRLLHTREAGRSWTPVRLDGVRARPLRIFFLDEMRGWLLCEQKQVYATQDGGRSWHLLETSRAPDLPAANTVYTWAAFAGPQAGFLTGWSRAPNRERRFPEWMEPEMAAIGRSPTTAILLDTSDGGRNWRVRLLPKLGEIVRLRLGPPGLALTLVQRPDALSGGSELLFLDTATLQTKPIYNDKTRWLTDVAFAGPNRVFAAAIDQPGSSPFPALPSRVKVLELADGRWREMDVDYRAEARRAILAVADAGHAWLATDTGMILKLTRD